LQTQSRESTATKLDSKESLCYNSNTMASKLRIRSQAQSESHPELQHLRLMASYHSPAQQHSHNLSPRGRKLAALAGVVGLSVFALFGLRPLVGALPHAELQDANNEQANEQEVVLLKALVGSGQTSATVNGATIRMHPGSFELKRTVATTQLHLRATPAYQPAGGFGTLDNTRVLIGRPSDKDHRRANAGGVTYEAPLEIIQPDGERFIGGILKDKNGHTAKVSTIEQLAAQTDWVDVTLIQKGGSASGVQVIEHPFDSRGNADSLSVALSNGHLVSADTDTQIAIISILPPVDGKLPSTFPRSNG
jgi:hypothetical protein